MRKTLFLIFLLLGPAAAIKVSVIVKGTLDGSMAHFTAEDGLDNAPQHFFVDWENIGSAACRTILKVKIFNETGLLYTGWSAEKSVEPGETEDFSVWWYPPDAGNYSSLLWVHYCDLVFEGPAINFSVVNSSLSQARPYSMKGKNLDGFIELTFTASEDVSGVVVSPRDYPLGWVVASDFLGDMRRGETKTARIYYEPSVWRPRNITFDVSSAGGGFHQVEVYGLERAKYSVQELVIFGLSALVVVLAGVVVYLFLRFARKS